MSAAFQSIWQLSRLLASGASTSVALVREHLDRIERLDGKLHAFVDVYADEALAAAEGLDRLRGAGVLLSLRLAKGWLIALEFRNAAREGKIVP